MMKSELVNLIESTKEADLNPADKIAMLVAVLVLGHTKSEIQAFLSATFVGTIAVISQKEGVSGPADIKEVENCSNNIIEIIGVSLDSPESKRIITMFRKMFPSGAPQ